MPFEKHHVFRLVVGRGLRDLTPSEITCKITIPMFATPVSMTNHYTNNGGMLVTWPFARTCKHIAKLIKVGKAWPLALSRFFERFQHRHRAQHGSRRSRNMTCRWWKFVVLYFSQLNKWFPFSNGRTCFARRVSHMTTTNGYNGSNNYDQWVR